MQPNAWGKKSTMKSTHSGQNKHISPARGRGRTSPGAMRAAATRSRVLATVAQCAPPAPHANRAALVRASTHGYARTPQSPSPPSLTAPDTLGPHAPRAGGRPACRPNGPRRPPRSVPLHIQAPMWATCPDRAGMYPRAPSPCTLLSVVAPEQYELHLQPGVQARVLRLVQVSRNLIRCGLSR